MFEKHENYQQQGGEVSTPHYYGWAGCRSRRKHTLEVEAYTENLPLEPSVVCLPAGRLD